MQHMTIADVIEVTNSVVLGETIGIDHAHGLTAKDLRLWQEHGVITPEAGGEGRGNHARFTPHQVVAIAAGAQWWRVGGSLSIVKGIVTCILSHSEEQLDVMVEAGQTMPFPMMTAEEMVWTLVPITKEFRHRVEILDLRYVRTMVYRKIDEIRCRPKQGRGRKRGLIY